MRQALVLAFMLLSNAAYAGADGHWAGTIAIPGDEVRVLVDLERKADGRWIGSITLPRYNLSAAPLTDISVSGNHAEFSIQNALGDEEGTARFLGDISGSEMTGQFLQAGHRADFAMRKTGSASVQLPPQSTPVPKALEGVWVGEFIGIGDYPRKVTLTLSNPSGTAAQAQFIVVGRQTTEVQVDLVQFAESLLLVSSSTMGIRFEGRYDSRRGEISGAFELGSYDFPLILHAKHAGASP